MGFEERVLIIPSTLGIQDTLRSPAFGALSHLICVDLVRSLLSPFYRWGS